RGWGAVGGGGWGCVGGGAVGCCLDLGEERVEYPVMRRRDPLAPDCFILAGGLAGERVTEAHTVVDALQVEPVLDPQSGGTDDAERANRPRAVELFPDHRARLVDPPTHGPRRRPDLRRPDPAEVRDERREFLGCRGKHALVHADHLHPLVLLLVCPPYTRQGAPEHPASAPSMRESALSAAGGTATSRTLPGAPGRGVMRVLTKTVHILYY